jgi:Magnesium chelatase, subunit ChlI
MGNSLENIRHGEVVPIDDCRRVTEEPSLSSRLTKWGVVLIISCCSALSGAGKSMLARRLTTLLPAMTVAEALETTRIHRVVGLTGDRTAVVTTRSFRALHHPSRRHR